MGARYAYNRDMSNAAKTIRWNRNSANVYEFDVPLMGETVELVRVKGKLRAQKVLSWLEENAGALSDWSDFDALRKGALAYRGSLNARGMVK